MCVNKTNLRIIKWYKKGVQTTPFLRTEILDNTLLPKPIKYGYLRLKKLSMQKIEYIDFLWFSLSTPSLWGVIVKYSLIIAFYRILYFFGIKTGKN